MDVNRGSAIGQCQVNVYISTESLCTDHVAMIGTVTVAVPFDVLVALTAAIYVCKFTFRFYSFKVLPSLHSVSITFNYVDINHRAANVIYIPCQHIHYINYCYTLPTISSQKRLSLLGTQKPHNRHAQQRSGYTDA